jgi:hypothetical protein
MAICNLRAALRLRFQAGEMCLDLIPQPLLLERGAEAGFPSRDCTELNATDHAAHLIERGDHDHGKIT